MFPDEGEIERDVPKTSDFPFYEDVPDYEANKLRFDYMDSEELMEQTDMFMKKIASMYIGGKQFDSIFFLDESARPLAYMFKNLFRKYVKDELVEQPQILFLNVGQEITLPDPSKDYTKEIGFSGNPESIRKAYGKWLRPNSNVLVVDEYSSTGKSLKRATDMVDRAFDSQGVSTQSITAYTKVPKWYHRPNYLGVRDMTFGDYLEYTRKEADREMGTSYSNIMPDEYGRLSTEEVPMDVQLKRLEIQRKTLHGDVGDIPTTKRRPDSKINTAREELRRMCTQITAKHKQETSKSKTAS